MGGFGPPDDKGGVMFAQDFVVFDEAHEMPEVAGDHLGSGYKFMVPGNECSKNL